MHYTTMHYATVHLTHAAMPDHALCHYAPKLNTTLHYTLYHYAACMPLCISTMQLCSTLHLATMQHLRTLHRNHASKLNYALCTMSLCSMYATMHLNHVAMLNHALCTMPLCSMYATIYLQHAAISAAGTSPRSLSSISHQEEK